PAHVGGKVRPRARPRTVKKIAEENNSSVRPSSFSIRFTRPMSTRLLLVLGFMVAGANSFVVAQGGPGTDRHGDALPEGAFARLGTLRFRGAAAPLAFSPDGKVLASVATGPAYGEVILWEAATGRPLRRLRAERGGIAAALSF